MKLLSRSNLHLVPLVLWLGGCGAAPIRHGVEDWRSLLFPTRWGDASRSSWHSEIRHVGLVSFDGRIPGHTNDLSFVGRDELHWRITPSHQSDLSSADLWVRGRHVFGVSLKFSGKVEAPTWMMGTLPRFNPVSRLDFQSENLTAQQIHRIVAEHFEVDESCISTAERLWAPSLRHLSPAHRVSVSCERVPLPFSVLISTFDGTVLQVIPEGFGLTGKGQVYKENKVTTPTPTLEDLPDLENGRDLNGRHLRIRNCQRGLADLTRCKPTVRGENGTFQVDPSQDGFDEVSAYYALSSGFAWHRSMMSGAVRTSYADFGLVSPIDVMVRAARRDSQSGAPNLDNASYLPHGLVKDGHPAIVVGTGWEQGDAEAPERLQYLGRDADVYRHELAHHIIMRSITDISGQGLPLHEGFADYFVFAQTGNNAIGESIVQDQPGALRRGDDTRAIDATLVHEEEHIQGEHWSSVLWSLRERLGQVSGQYVFDRIAWNSIDYLPASPGYYQAIAAFLKAIDALSGELGLDAPQVKTELLTVLNERGYFASAVGIDQGLLPPPAPFLNFSSPSVEATLVSTPRGYPPYKGPRPDQLASRTGGWQLKQAGCSVAARATGATSVPLLLLPMLGALLMLAKKKKAP